VVELVDLVKRMLSVQVGLCSNVLRNQRSGMRVMRWCSSMAC
jgi:hypothetical protein